MEQFDFKSCFKPGGHRAHEARLPGETGHFWKKRRDIYHETSLKNAVPEKIQQQGGFSHPTLACDRPTCLFV